MSDFIDITSVVLKRGMIHPTIYIQRIHNKISKNNLSLTFDGFVGEWIGCDTKIQFTCSKHGVWDTCSIDNFVNKQTICPHCAGAGYSLNLDEEVLKIKEILSNEEKYDFVELYEPNGKDSKLLLECSEHGKWNTCTINNFKKGNRCPSCANANLNIKLFGDNLIFYIIVFNDIIKYGVSTDINRRISDIRYKTKMDFKLIDSFKIVSNEIELHLKKVGYHSYKSKDEFGNGYTETVCIDEFDSFMIEVNKFR